MANRTWLHARTQGVEHVYLPVTLLGAGAAAPTLSEGDPNGAYFTVARAGVGSYSISTKDSFQAIVFKNITLGAGYKAVFGVASQNADKTWTIPFYTIQDPSSVVSMAVTAGGTGFTSQPTLAYNNAHGNVGLTATATIAAGIITAWTVTSGGYGTDTAAPTVTITGGGGSGATATTTLGNGQAADIPATRTIRIIAVFRNSVITP